MAPLKYILDGKSYKKYLIVDRVSGENWGSTRVCELGDWHGYLVALVSNGAINIQVYLRLICWNLADQVCLFWNRHLALLSQGEFSPLGQYNT